MNRRVLTVMIVALAPASLGSIRSGPISRTFDLERGTLCDLSDWTEVCVDAGAGQQQIVETIVDATGGTPRVQIGRCDAFRGTVVRLRVGRGSRLTVGEVQRIGVRGTVADSVWTDHDTTEDVGTKFARDLGDLIKTVGARCARR